MVSRRSTWLVATVAIVGLAIAFAPDLVNLSVQTPPATTSPHAFSERPPFGTPLPGMLAYLANDRIFTLVDLGTGHVVGSKGVPAERRPAAASATRAFLGSVPAARVDGNWDRYRSLPWDGTVYSNDIRGVSVAYAPGVDALAAAMQPLPGGGNGVVVVVEGESTVAASSSGQWRFATWIGDSVLVRELSGSDVNWWLIGTDGSSRLVPLPDRLFPVAGTAGRVFGRVDDAGVIVEIEDGMTTTVEGQSSWAAAWSPDGDLVATIGADATLFAYRSDGSMAWSVPLPEPVTRFRGGVAWGIDGSFLAVAAGGTIQAYDNAGALVGELSTGLPAPQSAAGAAFLALVADPPARADG